MVATPEREYKVIGTRPIRPDGTDKVTGRAQYGADIRLTGMLYARVKRSPHAHAVIKKIDASKALFRGHAIAAVCATDPHIAEDALDLIEVEYEVLPAVINVRDAMLDVAPILHDDLRTRETTPLSTDLGDKPTNIASHRQFVKGDVEAGFAEADIVIEREFKTKAVHQGYIEPHACVGNASEDGNVCLLYTSPSPRD